MKREAEREQRQREKKQQKKDLSAALRKNLMRRKAGDQKADAEIVVEGSSSK
jgi:hypothetical protein